MITKNYLTFEQWFESLKKVAPVSAIKIAEAQQIYDRLVEMLEMYIETLSEMKKPTCMFIGPKGVYEKHMELLHYNILVYNYE